MKRFYFEPSSYCQLRCVLCPSQTFDNERKGNMNLDKFNDLITTSFKERVMSKGDDFHLYGFGEPTQNPSLSEMIFILSSYGATTKINTNGLLLNEFNWHSLARAGLTKCLISVDGLNQETYAKYRIGGDFALLNENISHVCENKQGSIIELQFIVFDHNKTQIADFIEYSRKVHADIATIKRARTWDGSTDSYDGLKNLENVFIRSPSDSACRFSEDFGLVLQNGNLTICTADPFGKYSVGNIFDEGPKLWQSSAFKAIKETAKNQKLDNCTKCNYENSYIQKIVLK